MTMTEKSESARHPKKLLNRIGEFQLDCPILEKNKKGHNYKYTPLSSVITLVKPLLIKHKLHFCQIVTGETLQTLIYAEDIDEVLEINTLMPTGYSLDRMNIFQSYGSMLSYYKRYILTSALGIFSAKEDTDAVGKAVKVEPTKQSLNDKQFISLVGAINSSKFTLPEAIAKFDLSASQLETLNNIDI
jgi:hypothetical protein